MAAQEVEIKPFANYPKTLTTIRSNTDYTTVYALPLRTFPEDKVIEAVRRSGRTIRKRRRSPFTFSSRKRHHAASQESLTP